MIVNWPGFLRSDAMHNGVKICLGCILMFWIGGISYAQDFGTDKAARAFPFEVNDSVQVNVDLISGTHGYPVGYAAHLETDVCSDDLCKPVSITIRWDLLGQFTSYHTTDEHSLTKFDHIPLTEADHDQLHGILSDTAAVLRDYNVEDMIDTAVFLPSQQIDAVTRPTSLTFSAATVEGALYTVYTLWHFTNGAIRARMKTYTRSLMSDDAVLKSMLASENRDYVRFVFQNLTTEQRNRLEKDIVKLVGSSDTYIPHFALAQLEDSLLSLPNIQQQLLIYFPVADNTLKNALLGRLASVPMDANVMIVLLSSLSNLQEHHITKALDIIENNKPRIDERIRETLEILSRSQDRAIAQQARNTLSKIN